MNKKVFLFTTLLLSVLCNLLSAQDEVKISRIDCYNLGDGRYYCHDTESKKPLQGSVRIIDGYTSQYTEAVFKDGIPNGTWKLFKNNALIQERTYKSGIIDGAYKEYYADGSVKATRNYVDGKVEGKFVQYYADGKIESEINFKNGMQEGDEISYDRDGKIRSTVSFEVGKENGMKKELFKNSSSGDYEMIAYYKDGKKDGYYAETFMNGNLKEQGQYIDGKKDGTWEFGKRDGKRTRTEVYLNDEKIKETVYFTDGTVEVTREFKNGRKDGWERSYNYSDGKLVRETLYKEGSVVSSVTILLD